MSTRYVPVASISLFGGKNFFFKELILWSTDEGRLEEGLGATEPLVTNGDDLTVGKLVALLQGGGGGSGGHLVLEVQSHIAQLLLNVTHDLTLGCGVIS